MQICFLITFQPHGLTQRWMDIYKEMNAIWNYVTALDNYLLMMIVLKVKLKQERKLEERKMKPNFLLHNLTAGFDKRGNRTPSIYKTRLSSAQLCSVRRSGPD